MSTTSTIQESLDNIESEIARLEKARDALLELVAATDEDEDEAPVTKPARKSTRSTGSSRSTKAKVTEEEEPAPARRSRRLDKRAGERKAAKASNGDGDKPKRGSRKEQIIALLDEGLSPREVAEELGIATNYVYNVKRGL